MEHIPQTARTRATTILRGLEVPCNFTTLSWIYYKNLLDTAGTTSV